MIVNCLGFVVEIGELYKLNIKWKWIEIILMKSGVESFDGRFGCGKVSVVVEVWINWV